MGRHAVPALDGAGEVSITPQENPPVTLCAEFTGGHSMPPAGGMPEQFAAIIKRDIEVWRGVVQRAGVKAE